MFSKSTLHLVIPATNANQYLCQLLLSSIILNYPTPVFVNWDSPERADSPQQHVAKVDAIHNYLRSFPTKKDNDLVLVTDGFNVWFQLPPDLLLKRYFVTIEAQNRRLASRLGRGTMRSNNVHQSILFGADKACGPRDDFTWIGCWAAPGSPMPLYSYGPYNDSSFDAAKSNPSHARPRWLGSGMVIGPVKDVRVLFEETSKLMHKELRADSDQWYLSHLFGMQEYKRAQLEAVPSLPPGGIPHPEIPLQQKTEFHVGLDYENSMFQTLGLNDQYLTWWQHDGSMDVALPKDARKKQHHNFQLSQDLLGSRRPFESMHNLGASAYNDKYQEILKKTGRPDYKMWSHLPLLTNVITRHVIPMLHFSSDKDYRDIWWQKMWFYPYARDLMVSATRISSEPLHNKRIQGRIWYKSQTPVSTFIQGSNQERRDGAWNDRGEWKSFNSMCSAHESALFGTSLDSSVLKTSEKNMDHP